MELNPEGGIAVSPVVLGFGALDAMIAAQAAYMARDLSRKNSRKRKK
jgi:hypothetical protein